MMRINVNISPVDGAWFKENDGTILRGNTWRGLMSRVVAYRRRNKLPPGDPTAEVTAQACARSPGNCREDPEIAHQAAVKVASLKSRVLQWLAAVRARKAQAPLQFVDEALMRRRAAVCAGCPAHASIAGGCGSCKKVVKEVRADVLGGRPIAEVHGCQILGEDCAVTAWLGDVTVDDPSLPGCCWRRRSAPP